MSFPDAVRTVLTQKYRDFSGRASRSEYWWFTLFSVLLILLASLIDTAIGNTVPGVLVGVALLVPGLAVSSRRLHDTGRNGWWYLIFLTGVGVLVLLYWFATEDSRPGSNEWGAAPKQPEYAG